MDRRWLILGAIIVLAALIGGGIYLVGRGGGSADENGQLTEAEQLRQNTLSLAEDYFESGEYQRALDLVDSLLIKNAEDQEARILRDRIIETRKTSEAEKQQSEESRRAEEQKKQEELVDTLSNLGDSMKGSQSQAELDLKRAQELAALEEQKRAAEERRRQLEEERAAMAEAERKKQEQVDRLIEQGKTAMQDQQFV
ncbi:MAG: tetratricopeptide repeat protein, partial [Sediminispirochaetaceae bacterium]